MTMWAFYLSWPFVWIWICLDRECKYLYFYLFIYPFFSILCLLKRIFVLVKITQPLQIDKITKPRIYYIHNHEIFRFVSFSYLRSRLRIVLALITEKVSRKQHESFLLLELIISFDWQILGLISWKRGICLNICDKLLRFSFNWSEEVEQVSRKQISKFKYSFDWARNDKFSCP